MSRPFKPTTIASHDWDARADQDSAAIEDMPDCPERVEAMRKIELLRIGAHMRRALSVSRS